MTYRSRIPLKIDDKEKFNHICDLTTSLVGLWKGSLSFKSRKQEIQLPRLVAANIGLLNDIHHRVIAEVFNRDRSSVYHYESTHGGNYTNWKKYREVFNLVHQAYTEIETSKPSFKDNRALKRHILEFVKESEKCQVEILVTSGKVGCKIITSYREFSYVLKNIKFALANYRHSIDVNLL